MDQIGNATRISLKNGLAGAVHLAAPTDRALVPVAGLGALVDLEKRGLLQMLVTQNVDGLHQMAGNDPKRVVEIHGTVKEAMCLECDWRDDIEVVLQRVREGDVDPHCSCGGLLKSATVSFGQNLFPGDIDRMFDASLSCDLLLAVGTSLQVFPVAEMLPTAVNNGAKALIVNGESTVMDQLAEIVVKGEISKVLPEIVSL